MVFWEVYSLVLEVIKESVVEIMRRYRQAALLLEEAANSFSSLKKQSHMARW